MCLKMFDILCFLKLLWWISQAMVSMFSINPGHHHFKQHYYQEWTDRDRVIHDRIYPTYFSQDGIFWVFSLFRFLSQRPKTPMEESGPLTSAKSTRDPVVSTTFITSSRDTTSSRPTESIFPRENHSIPISTTWFWECQEFYFLFFLFIFWKFEIFTNFLNF